MASKSKKTESKSKKTAAKPAAKTKAKVAPKKAIPKAAAKAASKVTPKKELILKNAAPERAPKEGLTPEYTKEIKNIAKASGKGLTKAAPVVALSKILPKEELAASYELADSEVDDFEEDEKARSVIEEVEEDAEGPPEWWKDDPAAIEGPDEEEGDKADFDDSDEWTEDDEWADDEKKTDADTDEDDRDW